MYSRVLINPQVEIPHYTMAVSERCPVGGDEQVSVRKCDSVSGSRKMGISGPGCEVRGTIDRVVDGFI